MVHDDLNGGELVGPLAAIVSEDKRTSAVLDIIRGVAVGNGKLLDNGTVRALEVKVGDKVLFGKYSGNEVKVDGVDYLVMREDDVVAVLG